MNFSIDLFSSLFFLSFELNLRSNNDDNVSINSYHDIYIIYIRAYLFVHVY